MRFFLSPVGRMSRRDWWTKAVPAMALAFVAAGAIDVLVFGASFLFGPARLVLGLLFVWPSFTLMSQRLHDLNWSAAALAMPAVFLAAGPAIVLLGVELTGETITIITGVGAMVLMTALVLCAGFALAIGLAPGQRGPNRHGPDPLALDAAVA